MNVNQDHSAEHGASGLAYDGTLIPMAVGFVSLISLSVLLTAIVK